MIKRKFAMQRRDMRDWKRSSEREQVQISARRKMRMHDIKPVRSHLFKRFLQVIKGFQMHAPIPFFRKQRMREKGDKLRRGCGVTRGKQCNIMSLRYQFLHQIVNDTFRSTIVFRGNRDPGRNFMKYI